MYIWIALCYMSTHVLTDTSRARAGIRVLLVLKHSRLESPLRKGEEGPSSLLIVIARLRSSGTARLPSLDQSFKVTRTHTRANACSARSTNVESRQFRNYSYTFRITAQFCRNADKKMRLQNTGALLNCIRKFVGFRQQTYEIKLDIIIIIIPNYAV